MENTKTYANAYQEKINARLNPEPPAPRKQVMLTLREDDIALLTQLAVVIAGISGNKYTRNMLIEDALEIFIEESQSVLAQLRTTQ